MDVKYDDKQVIGEYLSFIKKKDFACIAAKAAVAKQQVKCFVADHMSCPKDDYDILNFLYSFIDDYRESGDLYHSAAVIFKQPGFDDESQFEALMWQRLQSLSDMDAQRYVYDKRVDSNIVSPDFSFSLKEEAFFIIGLHAASSRRSRRFKYATLVFNPHSQFEQLREEGKYDAMKYSVRKRDVAYSGSVNPMLNDFGEMSEIFQYSGRQYDENWQCPLKINHSKYERNSTP